MAEIVDVARAEGLADLPHGFLGRRGGVSKGALASLNVGLGTGDNDDAVTENRRRAVEAVLRGARLVTLYQTHSALAVEAGEWPLEERPRADALVTDRPGLLLGILTADCAPVLLADREAGVVGAAHAGWRGAHGGVLEATVAAMEGLGARSSRIIAAIGPTIAQASYEVSASFRDDFTDEDAAFFAAGRYGHWQFDLPAYAARRLKDAGIGHVDVLGLDTYALEDRYYSFRRATHRAEPDYGRQLSVIGLPH